MADRKNINYGLEGCVKQTPRRIQPVAPELDVTAITCDRIFPCDGTGTAINRRVKTVPSVASLVRVASGFHLQPSGKSTSGMAARRRTEMDRRNHQRFGTAMDLSEDESSRREGLLALCAAFAI